MENIKVKSKIETLSNLFFVFVYARRSMNKAQVKSKNANFTNFF